MSDAIFVNGAWVERPKKDPIQEREELKKTLKEIREYRKNSYSEIKRKKAQQPHYDKPSSSQGSEKT